MGRGVGPVLDTAAMGWWNPEARLLYDLQKVCLDCERKLYSVSVVDWLLDWRHWRRPGSAVHCRNSGRCWRASTCGRAARRRCECGCPWEAGPSSTPCSRTRCTWQNSAPRDQLRPGVASAIDDAGLRPRDAVERAARDKLVEELLDASVRRGFFGMADVRDAISRNQLKLNDLAGPAEFVRGDQLLRADRRLADVPRRRLPAGRDLHPLLPAGQLAAVRVARRAVRHANVAHPLRRGVPRARGARSHGRGPPSQARRAPSAPRTVRRTSWPWVCCCSAS